MANRDELKAKIAAEIRARFSSVVGTRSALAEIVERLVEHLREYAPPVPSPVVTDAELHEDGRFTCRVATTPEVVAELVAHRYAAGESHEDVTTWLRENVSGGCDKVFAEVETEDGRKVWTLRTSRIVVTVDISEPT